MEDDQVKKEEKQQIGLLKTHTNTLLLVPAVCSSQHPLTADDGAATAPLVDPIRCDV